MRRGYLFDVDGTLVEPFTSTILPGVARKIAEIQAMKETHLGFVTNRAGPGWRKFTGKTHFPTIQSLAVNLLEIATALSATREPWTVSLWDNRFISSLNKDPLVVDGELALLSRELRETLSFSMPNLMVFTKPESRKPGILMFQSIEKLWGCPLTTIEYVGDREDDEKAALAAGCVFSYANTFFQ